MASKTLGRSAVLLIGLLWPLTLTGQTTGKGGQLELGMYGTFTRYDNNSISLTNQFGAGGRMAFHMTNTFSLEASGDYTRTETAPAGDRVGVTRLSGTLFGHRRFVGSNALYLGLGYERLFYRAAQEFDDNGAHVILGNRLPLGGRAVFRIEGRATYYPSSPAQAPNDRVLNISAAAGLSVFSFGGAPRDDDQDGVRNRRDDCAETPFGATVDDRGCPMDEDLDGVLTGLDQCPDTPRGAHVDMGGCPADEDGDRVFDGIDTCPNTPIGAFVNETGCPSDTDNDGVFDGLDACDDTPAGATVDEAGCPSDEDLDGVFDGLDQCPGTPIGTVVDETGCPSDNDGDGVVNAADRCPNSPPGSQVNEFGCPPERDSDGDGIMDSLDRCPNTQPGQQIDGVGCPILFVVAEATGEVQPLILRGVNFATGRSTLTVSSHQILDEVAASLVAHPEVRIEVGGHTDATGSARTNERLSRARAEAVRAYLASKGVAVERMEARGYGPNEPIATNSTSEGRALNRRVELRLLEGDPNRP